MSESGLSLSYADIISAISARFHNDAAPTGAVLAACKRSANAGLRRFLRLKDWWFLTPQTTIVAWATATGTMTVTGGTTVTDSTNKPFRPGMLGHTIVPTSPAVAGTTYTITAYTSTSVVTVGAAATADTGKAFTITADGRVSLPDDFGYPEGNPAHAPSVGYGALKHVTPDQIRVQQSLGSVSGAPTAWSVMPRAAATTGQRWELVLWPVPDADYTLYYSYKVNAAAMTADAEYPPGGPDIGDAILQFAKAEHERLQSGRYGVENDMALKEALPAALRLDALMRPGTVGPMTDGSDGTDVEWDPTDYTSGLTEG